MPTKPGQNACGFESCEISSSAALNARQGNSQSVQGLEMGVRNAQGEEVEKLFKDPAPPAIAPDMEFGTELP